MEVYMKKLVAVLFLAASVVGAYAANPQLVITGNVASALSVALSSATATLAIDNTGAEVISTAASKITLISNQKLWTITVSSANNGVLKDSGTTDEVPYKVQIDTSAFANVTNALSSYVTVTTGGLAISPGTSGGKTPFAGKEFNINIKVPTYTAFFNTVSGASTAYTDTITVTLASA